MICICFFKQKTAYEMRISDWSSDVCSSDLAARRLAPRMVQTTLADYVRIERFCYQPALVNYVKQEPPLVRAVPLGDGFLDLEAFFAGRSEERRVGKECVSKCRYRG